MPQCFKLKPTGHTTFSFLCHSQVPCQLWRPQRLGRQSHLRVTDRRTGHREPSLCSALTYSWRRRTPLIFVSIVSLVRCLDATDYLQKSLDVYNSTFAKKVLRSWRFSYKPSFTFKVNACLQNRAPVPCSFPERLGLKAAARSSPWKPPLFSSKY